MTARELKVFFYYCITLTLFVIVSAFSLYILKSKTLYFNIIRLYTIIEYSLFARFLYLVYKNKTAKKIVILSIIPFFLFCAIDFLINTSNFNNYPLLVEFLSLIVFIIYYLYEKMKTEVQNPLYLSPTFWICVAMFMYFTGNFFFLIFAGSSSDETFVFQLKIIYSVVTIVKNILLCIALFAIDKIEANSKQLSIPDDMRLDDFSFTNLKNS